MKPIQIIAGLVAGAIGAAVWAAIAYFANIEIGYIAWGIGLVVGIAVAAAGENGPLAGITAVAITILSILGGKFATVEMSIQEVQAELENWEQEQSFSADEVSDDVLQGMLADIIAEQREAAGQPVQWPEYDENEESVEAAYPAEIWSKAGEQLATKTDEEKSQLRQQHVDRVKEWAKELGQNLANDWREEGFIASFGAMDLLFFGLAVFTAWGVASRDEGIEEPLE